MFNSSESTVTLGFASCHSDVTFVSHPVMSHEWTYSILILLHHKKHKMSMTFTTQQLVTSPQIWNAVVITSWASPHYEQLGIRYQYNSFEVLGARSSDEYLCVTFGRMVTQNIPGSRPRRWREWLLSITPSLWTGFSSQAWQSQVGGHKRALLHPEIWLK